MKTLLNSDINAAVILTLQNSVWFNSLPKSLRMDMMAAANILHLEQGQQLFAQGDPKHGLYAVVSGGISIGRQREDGKEALLVVIEPPNWFGEITLFDRGCRTHHAIAVSKTVLVEVNGTVLDSILNKQPRYWQYFGQLLTLKTRILLDLSEDMALLNNSQRLAKRLLLMAVSNGELIGRSKRVVEVQQEQLAMMLFITRQTTNHILKDLERNGFVKLLYGKVEILDYAGLKRFAEHAF